MNEYIEVEQQAQQNFNLFLQALNAGRDKEWQWLVKHLRDKAVPWIRKEDGNLPTDAIVSESYFIEEVFSESMIKFYELFRTGAFSSLGDLRGLLFKIAALKLKEGYRAVKRDKVIYFPELFSASLKHEFEGSEKEQIEAQQELAKAMQVQLDTLPKDEREILLRYSRGEKLKQISQDLSLKEETGRKKKQRALNKLRVKLYQALQVYDG